MTRPQSSSIRQQDDYELFQHILISWQSILATAKELKRRDREVIIERTTGKHTEEINPTESLRWKMEVR
jgi:hypothetical protein